MSMSTGNLPAGDYLRRNGGISVHLIASAPTITSSPRVRRQMINLTARNLPFVIDRKGSNPDIRRHASPVPEIICVGPRCLTNTIW